MVWKTENWAHDSCGYGTNTFHSSLVFTIVLSCFRRCLLGLVSMFMSTVYFYASGAIRSKRWYLLMNSWHRCSVPRASSSLQECPTLNSNGNTKNMGWHGAVNIGRNAKQGKAKQSHVGPGSGIELKKSAAVRASCLFVICMWVRRHGVAADDERWQQRWKETRD